MPIDYSKYHKDWKTVIRPDIIKRAANRCEVCLVPNYKHILRGVWMGKDCYQDDDGTVFCAQTGDRLGDTYVGEVHPTNKLIKVVLTISHLDHNIDNNDYSNLKAMCQRCHLRHDVNHHRRTRESKKQQIKLDL